MNLLHFSSSIHTNCTLSFALGAVLFGLAAYALAQQPINTPKIGWLGVRPAVSDTGRTSFVREFRALGYIDGKNVAVEYRSADDKLDRLAALAEELIRLKVDVLVAATTPAAVAAKNATQTTPVVFFGGFDPVVLGLVDSLARPGGNVTGFTAISPMLSGKAAGADQRGNSQTFTAGCTMGPAKSRLCAAMERKPIAGTRAGNTALFD